MFDHTNGLRDLVSSETVGRSTISANNLFTLWLFNIAMENGPCIDDFPIKTIPSTTMLGTSRIVL